MKKQHIEKSLRIAALLTLLLAAWKCGGQDLRINTAAGLVIFQTANDPDEICIQYGVLSGQVRAEHLGKTADDLPGKVAAVMRMADDAGVRYPDFLRENEIPHSQAVYEYYGKCRDLRGQLFGVIGERAFLEVRAVTGRLNK